MTDVNNLVSEGYRLSLLGENALDRARGRDFLEQAASLGRADALFFWGKSFEIEKNYRAAEEVYLRAFDKKYRAAMFRLARLHGKGYVKNPDRDFYLRTMEVLARDGHFPSIAIYTNERMRGSYGVAKQIAGLLAFFPNIFLFMWVFARDPKSHRFEQ